MTELYEDIYKRSGQFSFGKNWHDYLRTLTPEKINQSRQSMVDFVGRDDFFNGKTFLDVGSGSGLFSLGAIELGAAKVVSVDIDDSSLACTQYLREHYDANHPWEIIKGSALNENFLSTLGQFDIVLSWGVLHHTGSMWPAIQNLLPLVKPGGYFYLAIYNERSTQPLDSAKWLEIKRDYNNGNFFTKQYLQLWYMMKDFYNSCWSSTAKRWTDFSILRGMRYLKQYSKLNRGISWRTNIIDWLGGYPYEYSSVNTMVDFFQEHQFKLIKVNDLGPDAIGCNEFLFQRPT